MTALTEVFVTVRPDTDKFGPEVKKKLARIDATREGKQIGTRFGVGLNGAIGAAVSRSAGIFAAGFAAIKVGGFLKGAISQASDLGETMSKSSTVFGKSQSIIEKFASSSAKSLGQSKQEAVGAAAQFGNMFNQLGINQKSAANMSVQMVTLASDFASFHNADITEVLEAQQAAFRGEFDSIQKFVPTINAAAVEQEGLRLKLAGSSKELTEQDKAIATQSLLMKGAGKATGDFSRTSGGLANQQRILSAQFADFKASVGQVALPLVTKFVGFLNDKGVPILKTITTGAEAMAAAFSGEGVTSDGFVGFMERIGVAARGAFDYFKTDVLPRLKEFGSFLGSEVVPKIKEFAGFLLANAVPAISNLASSIKPLAQDVGAALVEGFQKLLPMLKDFGQFLADKVVPAIVDFTKWLKDNSTLVGSVAVGVGAMVIAFKGYQLALAAASAVTKGYAVVQGALNAVMAANPIGIVVLALVGLAAGLVYAYKKSETFRNIVNGAWNAIRDTAKAVFGAVVGFVKGTIDWIQTNVPPIFKAIAYPFTHAGELISGAWGAIKTGVRSALAWIVDKVLAFGETIIHGASKAFGWVPGLGDKLKVAATEFGKFRDQVNAKLKGINDEPVDIKVGLAYTQALGQATKKMTFATGGGVFGGVRGKDSVPALLMPDEHVWTTKEVAAAGGHGAMERLRRAALAGELNGYANGGVVVHPRLPSRRRLQLLTNAAAGAVDHTGTVMAKAIAKQLVGGGPSGPPGAKRSFRGVTLNQRTISMLLNAERLLGAMFHITQGSYSTRVAASGSTHAGGGAMDTNGPRGWNTAVAALRKAGFAAWHRTPSQGPWRDHIHSIAIGDSSASPAAMAQVRDFLRGGDGLGGMAKGGPVLFDKGGRWPSGMLGINRSGKTETVIPGDGTIELGPKSIKALARALAGEIEANPPRVHLDGRRIDEGMTRRALNGGY